jgi:hypothetical protein
LFLSGYPFSELEENKEKQVTKSQEIAEKRQLATEGSGDKVEL